MPAPFGILSPAEQAEIPPNLLDKIFGGLIHGLTTLPQRAFGASEQMRTEGPYNPQPILESAMLPMGTGAVAGAPIAAGETALGAGMLRRQPPVVGGYHATTADFDKFAQTPTHFSIDPNVARQFSLGHPNNVLYTEGSRTIPVVGDVQSPLVLNNSIARGIRDWGDSFDLLSAFDAMHINKQLPEGLMKNLSKIPEDNNWAKGFVGTLKDMGYDSVKYPHSGSRLNRPDAYMALDSEKVVPRFSPEGQKLIKARGILEPKRELRWNEKWRERFGNPGEYWSPRYNPNK